MRRVAAIVTAVVLIGLVAYVIAQLAAPGYTKREIAARTEACGEQGYSVYDIDTDTCREPRDPDAPPTAPPEL